MYRKRCKAADKGSEERRDPYIQVPVDIWARPRCMLFTLTTLATWVYRLCSMLRIYTSDNETHGLYDEHHGIYTISTQI